MTRRPDIETLASGVLGGERARLAQAITLIESRKAEDRADAAHLLERLSPHAGKAHRIGVTGVPGVGKSTFIEAFGSLLTGQGHRVAVLAVDPTSGRSGGSILGDKTRMERLAADPMAFIRPSPSGGMLGGVARATREAITLCEAAGFDIILVETVGAGQSEYMVADMVDVFLVLMLPGAGDELQGIKKGVLEMADILAVNKADSNPDGARRAARDLRSALHIITPADAVWKPEAMTISALFGDGLAELRETMAQHRRVMTDSGLFETRRRDQRVKALWSMIEASLLDIFKRHRDVAPAIAETERRVAEGEQPAAIAAMHLLRLFGATL